MSARDRNVATMGWPGRRGRETECDRPVEFVRVIENVAKRKLAPAPAECWIVASAKAAALPGGRSKASVAVVDVA